MRLRSAPSLSIAAIVASMTPVERAAPAGMGGADHAGLLVGEQHRPAIGGRHADGEAGRPGHDGVGARAVVARSTARSATTTSANGSDRR